MRRSAISEGIEKESEALPRLLVRKAERFEHASLHILPVNSDAAGAKLDSIQHEVVALRAAFPWRGLELNEILLDDPGERMLRAHPLLLALAPFEERKARDPGKLPFAAVN